MSPSDVFRHLIIIRPRRTRSSGNGDSRCFCLVVIVIHLVLIRMMTIWLLSHQLDTGTWYKLFCVLLLISWISFQAVCSLMSYANMSQSTDIFFTCYRGSLIKTLKRIDPKTEPCGTPNFTESSQKKEPSRKTHCILLLRFFFFFFFFNRT